MKCHRSAPQVLLTFVRKWQGLMDMCDVLWKKKGTLSKISKYLDGFHWTAPAKTSFYSSVATDIMCRHRHLRHLSLSHTWLITKTYNFSPLLFFYLQISWLKLSLNNIFTFLQGQCNFNGSLMWWMNVLCPSKWSINGQAHYTHVLLYGGFMSVLKLTSWCDLQYVH